MKLIRFLTGLLLDCNFFIAIAALLYCVQAQLELGLEPGFHPYLLLIFFATLFEYNFSKFLTLIQIGPLLSGTKHDWIWHHKKFFYVIVFISVIGFLITCFKAKFIVLVCLFPFGLLTLLYSIPVLKFKSKRASLRQIPLFKTILIGVVWASVTVILPAVESGKDFSLHRLMLLILQRFLFIVAITIPFDIRDMKSDQQTNTQTIPLLIGELNARRISVALLALFALISFEMHPLNISSALLLSTVLTLFCILYKPVRHFSQYHYLVLDGMIPLQAVAVMTLHTIF